MLWLGVRAANHTVCSRLREKHTALFILLETVGPRDCLSQGFYGWDERHDQKQFWGVGSISLTILSHNPSLRGVGAGIHDWSLEAETEAEVIKIMCLLGCSTSLSLRFYTT